MKKSYVRACAIQPTPHTQQGKHHQGPVVGNSRQGAGLTPTQSMILHLQRTAGNAAVNALLQQYARAGVGGPGEGARNERGPGMPTQRQPQGASSRTHVQRWPTNTPSLDLNQTQSITPIMSGQPVLFFRDQTDPPIVVKAEDAPYGLAQLTAVMHKQVHGTATVSTRDGSGARETLLNLIGDPTRTSGPAWTELGEAKRVGGWVVPRVEYDEQGVLLPTPGNTPAEKARHFMVNQFRDKPKMQIMSVATGTSPSDQARADSDPNREGPSRYRAAFDDMGYVTKLGQLTAADLFVENDDRARSNFGNWMVDADNAITLIDNMDRMSRNLWSSPELIGPTTFINDLAPSRQEDLAGDFVELVSREVANEAQAENAEGAAASINAWIKGIGPTGNVREEALKNAFINGVAQGRSRIIKLYATKKMSRAGRLAKRGAKRAFQMDVASGDQQAGGISYWERLKARARYLKDLT